MDAVEELLSIPLYSLNSVEKKELLEPIFRNLTEHHINSCEPYKKILNVLNFEMGQVDNLEKIPFLPVRIFKDYELLSVEKSSVAKTMTSSGTSGAGLSKIFLDNNTARNQSKVLAKLFQNFMGGSRLPMLVIDSELTVKNREAFSARTAGIRGFSIFGVDVTYALNDDMSPNIEAIKSFIQRHAGERTFIFGFTSIIWEHLVEPLRDGHVKIYFPNSVVLHGGGWKKLESLGITSEQFASTLHDLVGVHTTVDYYGMIEQTGSVFMQCIQRNLHVSEFSEVFIRKSDDFSVCDIGEEGLIQVMSVLPTSYPGHSILTEDLGVQLGVDDCACGRMGKYFRVRGRVPKAELRGCSDTYSR